MSVSKLWTRIAGFFSSRSMAGVDKAGNRYFARKEEIDGVMKEKKWVVFKGEDDPTSIPVEWICWLNGQRKTAPTPEERMELETKRERVRLNVALLKKEEEERRAKEGSSRTATKIGKVDVPDLRSFIQQFPNASKDYASERYIIPFWIANHLRLGSCDPVRNSLGVVRIVVEEMEKHLVQWTAGTPKNQRQIEKTHLNLNSPNLQSQ